MSAVTPSTRTNIRFAKAVELDFHGDIATLSRTAKALAIIDVDGTLTAGSVTAGDRYIPIAGCWSQLHIFNGTYDDPGTERDGAETLVARFLTTPVELGGGGMTPADYVHIVGAGPNRAANVLYLETSDPVSYEDFCRADMELLLDSGLTRDKALAIVRRIPRFPGGKELVDELQGRGYAVVLISSGLEIHVAEVARELGVSHFAANRFGFTPGGVLTGELLVQVGWTFSQGDPDDFLGKAGVVEELRRRSGLPVELAVGDSPGDFGVFAQARRAVLVPDASHPPQLRTLLQGRVASRARREIGRTLTAVQSLDEVRHSCLSMPVSLSELMSKRFLLVSGKGGVGKSTVVATLALLAMRRGKKVLVMELDTKERIPAIFGHADVGTEIAQIYQSIWSVNVVPQVAVNEYGLMKLRLHSLTRLVFDNPVVRHFLNFLPGMRELVLIGKAYYHELEVDPETGRKVWDMIILDGPATGHGIPLFRLPQVILDVVPVGPLAAEAQEIQNLLTDDKRTALNIVTLLEEMPVNETIELYEGVKEQLEVPLGLLFINSVYPPLFASPSTTHCFRTATPCENSRDPLVRAALKYAELRLRRTDLQQSYIDKLEQRLPLPSVRLPYLFAERIDLASIDQLARVVEDSLGP
ncbi:MAG: haloacid dehalogenase-like hydrolase [Candidatus Schekmanbacteria bacterium]|nr:haloacid dehalogenase-like hydrolase [Candidatus Schekmanbacteria bacterium]